MAPAGVATDRLCLQTPISPCPCLPPQLGNPGAPRCPRRAGPGRGAWGPGFRAVGTPLPPSWARSPVAAALRASPPLKARPPPRLRPRPARGPAPWRPRPPPAWRTTPCEARGARGVRRSTGQRQAHSKCSINGRLATARGHRGPSLAHLPSPPRRKELSNRSPLSSRPIALAPSAGADKDPGPRPAAPPWGRGSGPCGSPRWLFQ